MLAYFNMTLLMIVAAYVAGGLTMPMAVSWVKSLLAKIGSKL